MPPGWVLFSGAAGAGAGAVVASAAPRPGSAVEGVVAPPSSVSGIATWTATVALSGCSNSGGVCVSVCWSFVAGCGDALGLLARGPAERGARPAADGLTFGAFVMSRKWNVGSVEKRNGADCDCEED